MFEIKNKKLVGYAFIDLFAGIGGFHLALSSFGAKCVFACEIDKACQKVYENNFRLLPQGDITQIDEKLVPDHDILCAGFPCQPFSISGKQQGFNDNRGRLFFEVLRIIKTKKPKIIFLENVKNFMTHHHGQTFAFVKSSIEIAGYHFFAQVLNASHYGIPQNRERLYMIGIRNDLDKKEFIFPPQVPLKKHVLDLLENQDCVSEKLSLKRNDYVIRPDISSPSDKCVQLGVVNKEGQGERIYSIKGIGITLSANGGGIFAKTGGYLINNRIRRLTPRECARMMGFSDEYKIDVSSQKAYHQFGNAVVVDVIQYLIMSLVDILCDSH